MKNFRALFLLCLLASFTALAENSERCPPLLAQVVPAPDAKFFEALRDPAKSVVHKKSEIQRLYRSGLEPRAITKLLLADLLKQSTALKEKLAREPANAEIRTYDYIYVGAGIHSGIVKSAFQAAGAADAPNPKILTIEATDQISVFGRTGQAFFGNTLEHPELGKSPVPESELRNQSRNFIPEAPIQVFDVAKGSLPKAVDLQAPAVASHWVQGGDFLFQSRVTRYSKVKEGPRAGLYEIQIKGAPSVFTKNLVLATGSGVQKLPTTDPRSLVFLKRDTAKADPAVVFVEDLLSDIQEHADEDGTFLRKFDDEDLIIAGGGHGGAIGFEAIEGLGPPELYLRQKKRHGPRSYLWVSLKAKTGEEFKKVIGGGTRYYAIAPSIDSGRILTNDYYIHEILRGKQKRIRVSFLNPKTKKPVLNAAGKIKYYEASRLIYAVGYRPINPELSKGFVDYTFEPVTAPITPNDQRLFHESAVVVATRLTSPEGAEENVFAAGPSAGPIPHANDPGGPSSVTINVFGSRSQALGIWLRRNTAGLK